MQTLYGAIPRQGNRRIGVVGPRGAAARGTYTLASLSTLIDNSGLLSEYGNNVPRIYTGTPRTGLQIEPAQTNYTTNPRAEGGGVGVAPTGWSLSAIDATLTFDWLAQKVVSGVTYQPVRISGTPTGTLAGRILFNGSATGTVAAGLTPSIMAAVSGGSQSGFTGILLRVPGGTPATTPLSLSGVPQRSSMFCTYAVDSVGQAMQIQFNCTAATPLDLTIDLAAPNLVDTNQLTSPILPPIGSPAQYSRAATREFFTVTGTFGEFGGTAVVEGTIFAQANTLQGIVALDDGTFGNRLFAYVDSNTNTVVVAAFVGGGNTIFAGAGTITFGQPFKLAMSFDPTVVQVSINGGAVATFNGGVPMSLFTTLEVGTVGVNAQSPMNGTVNNASILQDAQRDATLRAMSTM